MTTTTKLSTPNPVKIRPRHKKMSMKRRSINNTIMVYDPEIPRILFPKAVRKHSLF